MKHLNYVLVSIFVTVLFSSCEKESVIKRESINNTNIASNNLDAPNNDSNYFSYDVSNIEEVIRLATEEDNTNDNGGSRTVGPTIEIVYDGIYRDCGDGSATCLPPENLCAIIITADRNINSVGNTTEYTDSDIIKMYSENPVRVSYNKIAVTMGATLNYPNALSTLVFE